MIKFSFILTKILLLIGIVIPSLNNCTEIKSNCNGETKVPAEIKRVRKAQGLPDNDEQYIIDYTSGRQEIICFRDEAKKYTYLQQHGENYSAEQIDARMGRHILTRWRSIYNKKTYSDKM